jgi:NADH-quinone oxidoreductase subunit C
VTLESKLASLASALEAALGDAIVASRLERAELTLTIAAPRLHAVCKRLKDDAAFGFTQLTDLSGVDYLTYGQADWQTHASASGFSRGVARNAIQATDIDAKRFAVTYQLISVSTNLRVRLKVELEGEHPRVASVTDIWPVADWYEREAFDLFGILFDGHPDLRRILTDYGFIGHPFRKDFPLEGRVEVRYDAERGRVIYQPVSIEPRTLVPRVIREESWLESSKPVSKPADA